MLIPVLPMASLSDGDSAACRVEGRDLLVVFAEGAYFAVDALCSHAGQSLANGRIVGREIICPLHGARFDLRTGACTKSPASQPLTTYPVLVEGGKICIEMN